MKRLVVISLLTASDEHEFLSTVSRSRALHGRWISPVTTTIAFRERLQRMQGPTDFAYIVRRIDTNELTGCIEITQVVRVAFDQLGLHRLEANIQPDNEASRALIKACGFQQEGFSPRYLKIRGL